MLHARGRGNKHTENHARVGQKSCGLKNTQTERGKRSTALSLIIWPVLLYRNRWQGQPIDVTLRYNKSDYMLPHQKTKNQTPKKQPMQYYPHPREISTVTLSTLAPKEAEDTTGVLGGRKRGKTVMLNFC